MPGRGMGTRRTPTGGRGEGGEVGGRVAYMYMLPAILPLGNVVALAYNPAPFIFVMPPARRGAGKRGAAPPRRVARVVAHDTAQSVPFQ